MSFLFNVPDSLKKTQNAAGNTENSPQNRAFQRPTTNYSDLDAPSGGGAPPAPERRQRLGNVMSDRSKFSLRRAPDGSILPKPTIPARTIGNPLAGAPRPLMPTRATLTHAGLIPAGARNPYTLKRTGPGKPAIPERHPSPLRVGEGKAATEEGELPEEEEQGMRGRGSARFTLGASRPEQTVKFADLNKQQRAQIPSLFGGGTSLAFGSAVDGGGSTTEAPRPLFGSRAGRTPSPSGMTRRREASPLHVPPPVAARAAAAAAAPPQLQLQQQESRGERSSARTLTAHDLTGMRSVTDVARSLRRLIGRACPADFDRYQLLDERDKLLCKLREIKPTFFSKTGSCKDMCPEKERYVRVVQMRVADYELDMLGDMEPRRMVKEYSRSAADQEEPLEHEMRPSAVLEKTMEYLLTDIVDGTIESSADASSPDAPTTAPRWYDFLWNRTRAIRKELTQQMILDESAVRLIECCTRMHMYAGHALGRLPREEFDPAMCEENLSKCLQSLRHLYEDLAKKEIFVESEAEFRAYDVMLHLTDSNILRQVLSYRRAVRESPAVRLALKLFSAIQSNNYTRFFRLVREQATYAQCCILYRYFGKMRLHAFSTMATAYKGGTLPMALIAKVLAFENVEQAIDVAACYGLQYTQDAAGVPALLPENKDFNPAAGEAAGAVIAGWIEQKRQGRNLSEIFRGGAARLSSSYNADVTPPVDSFDPSTDAYSHDPVLNEYLRRMGSAAPDDSLAPSSVVTRAQQKQRAEIVVERPAAALAAAAAGSNKPAFGGLSSFGKPPATSTAATSEGGATTGGFSSFAKSMGGGSSFGSGSSAFGSGLSTFGAKPVVPGFSFASSSSAATSEATTLEEKKPLFGMIKQDTNTVPKFAPKREVSEAQVEQTAERLYERVVDETSRDIVQSTLTEVKREEEERREKERIRKEQQERAEKEALERAAAAAAAAKSAEKRRRSEQARMAACSDHLFKRALWPALVKEVIDVATRAIVQEAVREEEQRIADGVARYKQRMHDLWLRQFTDRWKVYARWKKEERVRVRHVLAAIVSRNPFDGIGAASLKRRISSPDPDDWRAKKARGGGRDPLTTLAVLRFVERRQARIVLCVVGHWREWAERRARRRDEHKWPLNRACVVPRVRPPTPTDEELHQQQQDENDYGGHNITGLPLMEERRATAKKHKSRRSVGLYPFLAHDDSFLDGRATPIRGATPMREEERGEQEGQRRRKLRVSGIFNSTAVAETTAVPAIGFQTFVGQQQESAVSDADVEYAAALMEQTQWMAGDGARERWRRKEQRRRGGGEEERRRMEEWESRPLEPLVDGAVPSWRGLFDVLNAEPEGGRGHSLRAHETAEPLLDGTMNGTVMMRVEEQERTMRLQTPLETHWQREEREQRDRIAARNAAIDAQLAESKRLREEAAADRARQDALLAQLEC